MSEKRESPIKKIRKMNGDAFLLDFKQVREFMAFCSATKCFIKVRKMDIKEEAQKRKIHYSMRNDIFVVKRWVMVIL